MAQLSFGEIAACIPVVVLAVYILARTISAAFYKSKQQFENTKELP